jgi:hypothetical protein
MGFSVRLRSFLHMCLKYGQRIRRSNSLFNVCIQYCKHIEENRRGWDQRQLQLSELFDKKITPQGREILDALLYKGRQYNHRVYRVAFYPIVRTGFSQPLTPQRVMPHFGCKGGGHTRFGEGAGAGGANLDEGTDTLVL